VVDITPLVLAGGHLDRVRRGADGLERRSRLARRLATGPFARAALGEHMVHDGKI
jgi:hypothetical protein